jgi:hypothetical protein
VPLLALADLALVDGGGHFRHPEPVREYGDEQFGRLVLRLLQADRPGYLGAHGTQTERGVGDALSGQQADGHGEHPGAQAAHRVLGLLAAELARPGDEIGAAVHHGP